MLLKGDKSEADLCLQDLENLQPQSAFHPAEAFVQEAWKQNGK